MSIKKITDRLVKELDSLTFKEPVTHVYNPLTYARSCYDAYFDRFGDKPKEILMIGMNPGPFGMVQTGVPFGEVNAVKNWLGIQKSIVVPKNVHPKRPVLGFDCERSEVSGRRVWGWAEQRFETPDRFFSRFLILNYCPLAFLEESGRNRTPDKLSKDERESLFGYCDSALKQTVEFYSPKYVLGIGTFAEKRAKIALEGMDVQIERITHPSPANPKANKGWFECVDRELQKIGIVI